MWSRVSLFVNSIFSPKVTTLITMYYLLVYYLLALNYLNYLTPTDSYVIKYQPRAQNQNEILQQSEWWVMAEPRLLL